MNTKTTIAVLLIAAALGGYVYVVQNRPAVGPSDGDAAAAGERVFPADRIKADDPAAVTVTLAGKPPMRFEKVKADAWAQTAPASFPAMAWTLEQIARDTADLRYTTRFDPAAKDLTLDRIGLDPPRAIVEVSDKAGKSLRVALGNTTAGGRAYAIPDYPAADDAGETASAAAKPSVYVIDASLARQFEGDVLVKLRNRSPITLDAGEADEATLTLNGTAIKLVRRDTGWMLSEPVAGRADRNQVASLIGVLGGLRIDRFVADAPQSPADYGLDAPQRVLSVRAAAPPPPADRPDAKPAEPVTHTLSIGSATDPTENAFFATLSGSSVVFVVPRQTLDQLDRKTDDLRDARIVAALKGDLTEISVQHADNVAWRAVKDQGVWKFGESGPGFKLDAGTLQGVVDSFFTVRAQRFAPPDADDIADDFMVRVGLTLIGRGASQTFDVHAAGDEGAMLAVIPSDEKLAYIVPREPLKQLLRGVDTYRDRTIVDAAPDDLWRVRIERGGRWPATYQFERAAAEAEGPKAPGEAAADATAAGDWKLDGLDRGVTMAVLAAIAPLQAERWSDEAFDKDSADVATVTLTRTGDEREVSFVVDYMTGRGSIEGMDLAFELNERLASAFAAELRPRQVMRLTIEDIASIRVGESTVTLDADGRYALQGEGELREAAAAAMFDAAASLAADHFLPTAPEGEPTAKLIVTARTGDPTTIELWEREAVEPVARVGEKVFTIAAEAMEALTAPFTREAASGLR